MKIIVCLQQIFNPHYAEGDAVFDELANANDAAVAAAANLKEAGGGEPDVIILGAGDVRRALSVGGDSGVSIKLGGKPDAYSLADAYAQGIKQIGSGLVVTAAFPEGFAASLLSGLCGLPCVANAVKISFGKAGAVIGTAELGANAFDFELPVPCVISVKPDAWQKAHGTVHGIIKAQDLPVKEITDIALAPSVMQIVGLTGSAAARQTVMLTGNTSELAVKAADILQRHRRLS